MAKGKIKKKVKKRRFPVVKRGDILPLLPLLGVIGSLPGGAAGVAKAMNDAKYGRRVSEVTSVITRYRIKVILSIQKCIIILNFPSQSPLDQHGESRIFTQRLPPPKGDVRNNLAMVLHRINTLTTLFQQLQQEASCTAQLMMVVQDALSVDDLFQ
nr:PREDICTED: uncharacterized protein LOC105680061 [Linepithema humile]